MLPDVQKFKEIITQFASTHRERMERLNSECDDRTMFLMWGLIRREKDYEINGNTIIINGQIAKHILIIEQFVRREWMTRGPIMGYHNWVKVVKKFPVGTVIEHNDVEEDQTSLCWRYVKTDDNQWSVKEISKKMMPEPHYLLGFAIYQGIREDIAAYLNVRVDPDYHARFSDAFDALIADKRKRAA